MTIVDETNYHCPTRYQLFERVGTGRLTQWHPLAYGARFQEQEAVRIMNRMTSEGRTVIKLTVPGFDLGPIMAFQNSGGAWVVKHQHDDLHLTDFATQEDAVSALHLAYGRRDMATIKEPAIWTDKNGRKK
jgi:hypothetical protein